MKFPDCTRAGQGLTLRVGSALVALSLSAGCSSSILLDAVRPALLPGRVDLVQGPIPVPPALVRTTPGRG